MTLVVYAKSGDNEVAFSDMMLSSDAAVGDNSPDRGVPTAVHRFMKDVKIDYDFKLAQKIIEFTDGSFLLWADSFDVGRNLFEKLDVRLPLDSLSEAEFKELCADASDVVGKNIDAILITHRNGKNILFKWGNVVELSVGEADFIIIGGGHSDFKERMEQLRPDIDETFYASRIEQLIFHYCVHSLFYQRRAGYGFGNRWGGAIEFLIKGVGGRMEKINNTLLCGGILHRHAKGKIYPKSWDYSLVVHRKHETRVYYRSPTGECRTFKALGFKKNFFPERLKAGAERIIGVLSVRDPTRYSEEEGEGLNKFSFFGDTFHPGGRSPFNVQARGAEFTYSMDREWWWPAKAEAARHLGYRPDDLEFGNPDR